MKFLADCTKGDNILRYKNKIITKITKLAIHASSRRKCKRYLKSVCEQQTIEVLKTSMEYAQNSLKIW